MLRVGASARRFPPTDVVTHHLPYPPSIALDANLCGLLVHLLVELLNLVRVFSLGALILIAQNRNAASDIGSKAPESALAARRVSASCRTH